MTKIEFLTIDQIAVILDVKPKSVRMYHTLAQRHRRDGTSSPFEMPPPDFLSGGRYPRWKPSTIDKWVAIRHTPGRPRKGKKP